MQPLLLVWILLIGFMFYFLMIKPQKKARAQQVDMLSHLKVGSEVRTTAQIMGTVVELGEDYAVVETTPGVLIKLGKPAIVGIVLPDESEDEAADADAADATDAAEQAVPTPGGIGDAPAARPDAAVDSDAAAHADAEPKADAEPVSKP